VGGVGDEVALRAERGLQPGEQVVEGVGEVAELVAPRRQAEAPVKVRRRDLPRGGGDHPQGPQEPPGDPPAEQERDDEQQHEREERGEQDVAHHRVRGVGPRRRDGCSGGRGLPDLQDRDADEEQAGGEEGQGVQEHELPAQTAHHEAPIR
jgi:hypothetical protein